MLKYFIVPCPDFDCGENQVSIGNIVYDESRQCVTDICECNDNFINFMGKCIGEFTTNIILQIQQLYKYYYQTVALL